MARQTRGYDLDEDDTPTRPGQLSSNGHWIFGSIYACLALLGFGFGVWAGVAKPKAIETADAKQKETPDKPQTPKSGASPDNPPSVDPPPEPEPKPKTEPKPDPKPDPKPQPKTPPKTEPPKTTPPKTEPPKTEPPKTAVKAVAFKEVAPIIRTYCGNCHGNAGKAKGGVDLSTLAMIRKGDENGKPLVVAGKPEKSPLYESITAGRMPEGGKTPPPAKELQLLHDWIAGGAKERRTIRRQRAKPFKVISRKARKYRPEAGMIWRSSRTRAGNVVAHLGTARRESPGFPLGPRPSRPLQLRAR